MATIARIGRLTQPLTIRCTLCGHLAPWTPQEARRRLGGDCIITDARRRLACAACRGAGRTGGFVEFA